MARMEDVLELYSEDSDPERPVVCFDETSRQLIEDTRTPIAPRAGRVQRYDYETEARNLFMFCERQVEVTASHRCGLRADALAG